MNLLKEFLYFSRKEMRGIVVLIILVCIAFAAEWCYMHYYFLKEKVPSAQEIEEQERTLQEYERFIASIRELEAQPKEPTGQATRLQEPPALFPFDPNSADSITFRRLGMPGWMARNILRYRSKGGRFRRPEEFKKIYGMTEEQYGELAPYIRIAPEEDIRQTTTLYQPPTPSDSIYKYPAGTLVDLNRADTSELKKIPGIGSGIARMIVNYRQQLGGFYRIEQLQEIHLDHRQLSGWFDVRPEAIRRIHINRTGIDRLRQHPYINFYQAKAIVEYRKKKGALHNLKPFVLYEEFTEEDLERIGHYVCFDEEVPSQSTAPSFR